MKKRQREEGSLSDEEIERLATRLYERRKMDEKDDEQRREVAAKYEPFFFGLRTKFRRIVGREDGEIEERIRLILGDVVNEQYTIDRRTGDTCEDSDEKVTVYSFIVEYPLQIDSALFELLSDLPSVVSVQIHEMDTIGCIRIEVHTTGNAQIAGKYYDSEMRVRMDKAEVELVPNRNLDTITKTTLAMIKTHFDIVQGLGEPHPVKQGFTSGSDRKLLDIHTIGVRLPIYIGQIKALKANKRFFGLRFGPDERTKGCLMTFDVYSVVTQPPVVMVLPG